MSKLENIPAELRALPQWVLWRRVVRDGKPTKIPYSVSGQAASTTDPRTWSTFDAAVAAARAAKGSYSGLGYVFSKDDPYVGVDLDDCRNKDTGELQPWATRLIADFNSYAEVSPSKTGVKLWIKATLPPGETGKRTSYESGAVEIYQSGRYFAVTGESITPDNPTPIAHSQSQLSSIWSRLFGSPSTTTTPVGGSTTANCDSEACWAALEDLPDSVAGEQGHDKMLRACCEILRHGIDGDEAWGLIDRFNAEKCDPEWSRKELEHKWKSAQGKVLRGREFGVLSSDPEARKRYRLGLIEYHDFLTLDFPQRYLVKGLVVEGEHLIIGGPKKALKTGLTMDLMISLASKTPFLGEFEVERQTTVAFISGESGRATLQRAAARIAQTRGAVIPPERWFIGFDLPQIANPDHLAEIERAIRDHNIGFLAVDPAYLATLQKGKTDGAGNVFAMGLTLAGLGRVGVETGCTVALVHHARKQNRREAFKPLDLDDLTQAGFAEWARQWLLIGRRSAFKNGRHELWLNAGGSAGHGGAWEVDVNEGDPEIGEGRLWEVDVRVADGDAPAAKAADDLADDSGRILTAVLDKPGASPNALRDALKVGKRRIDAAIADLQAKGKIDVRKDQRGWQSVFAVNDFLA